MNVKKSIMPSLIFASFKVTETVLYSSKSETWEFPNPLLRKANSFFSKSSSIRLW